MDIKSALRQPWDTISAIEFKKRFCGKFLGEGVHRQVYDFKLNRNYIVKIQKLPAFQNNYEKEIWFEVGESPSYGKLFAPIVWSNRLGTIIIMRKVKVMKYSKRKPPRHIEYFFGDCHNGNFGWIGNRFVCIDYGNILISRCWNLQRKQTIKDWNS